MEANREKSTGGKENNADVSGKIHERGLKKSGGIAESITAVVVLLAVFISQGLAVPCLNRYYLGISCPGCGMTRAWLSALRMDFKQAFYYHPLFLCVPFIIIWVFIRKKMPPWLFKTVLYVFLAVYIGVYIYRFLYSDHVVVNINIEEGRLFRMLAYFQGR